MDERSIRELFGWLPAPGKPNYRKLRAGGRDFLQIVIPVGGFASYVCVPLQGRPDMSRPHGCDTFLDFLRARLEAHGVAHGSDEGFRLGEGDLDEIGEEILDFYRRRRFLLEVATPASEFETVERDGEHALQLMDMLDRYCADRERAWNHRKYEPYIRCHITQARMLRLFLGESYREAVEATREGMATIAAFDRRHEPWEYSGIDESIYPRSLIASLAKSALELLEQAQGRAVEAERYEDAALIRDLMAEFGNQAG